MASKLEELNLTSDELQRFRSAFQDAGFRELFAQYAEEISNPENRRRYEQEIAEMERERGMDVRFLHPLPGHVLLTSLDGERSCYLNICSSELVGKARCVPGTDPQGRPGQHWSLPCSLSPAREDLAPEGGREVIYDVIFHPDTLRLAARSDKLKAMVDQTAIDTVARSFNVVLDGANVQTVQGAPYRGVPQPIVIRTPRPGAQPKPQDPGDPLSFPYPYDVPGGAQKPGHQPKPQDPGDHRHQPKPSQTQLCDPKPAPEPTVPRYTIRHRSYVDIQDYRDARDAAPSPVPKELVITVDLPLLTSASEVTLHIEGKEFSLESPKPAYRLNLTLPYLVQDERGNAQFNKIKRQLVVTVPVVPQRGPKLLPDRPSEPSESPETEEQTTAGDEAPSPLPKTTPECPIFTCSQDATSLTLVIHVKDIDEQTITSEVSSYQCEIRFRVRDSNTPHVLFVEFLPQYSLSGDIAIRASIDNTVIELTKASECFGLWKNLYFGVDSNSLQERRFVNEDNVAEFLESGLRPSTIPWSTLEDPPLINVLEMNEERTRILLDKPKPVEERYLAHRAQYTDLSDIKKKIQYESGAEDCPQDPAPANPEPPCTHNQPAADPPEESSAEDEGLVFKDIPPNDLDEDDLPDDTRQNSAPILREVDAKDGSETAIANHTTQCAFRFDNALLYDLD